MKRAVAQYMMSADERRDLGPTMQNSARSFQPRMDAAFALSLHPLSYAEANFGVDEGLLAEGAEVEVARRHFSEPLVADLDVLELAELRPGARSRALSRELAERYPSSTRYTPSELWEWLCVEWLVAHWDSRPDPLDDVGRLTADFGYPAWFDLYGALCGFYLIENLRARALGELSAARGALRRRCRT